MLEWLKRHAWKACIRQKRIRGSNPRLSAKQIEAKPSSLECKRQFGLHRMPAAACGDDEIIPVSPQNKLVQSPSSLDDKVLFVQKQ